MEEGNLESQRHWGLEPTYDSGRMIEIYNALHTRVSGKFTLVDVACGCGIIADGLSWAFREALISQFDISYYKEWNHLGIKPSLRSVESLMASDEQYDVILFLNSLRNWERKDEFVEWASRHCKFLISSNIDGTVIGHDVKGFPLVLKEFHENVQE